MTSAAPTPAGGTGTDPLAQLSAEGVSVWLDDLSRELLESGELQRLVDEKSVVGVTSNPTIFASALSKGDAYEEQTTELARRGADVEEAIFEITTEDVRRACDLFAPVYERSDHHDGRVSLEVEPGLAHDTEKTVAAARQIWSAVDRPNLMVKIPATVEGLPAITTALSEGISVNVTLIFSLDRYRAVMNAFLTGLEQAREAGRDLSQIASVASFFVSRVDSEIDGRLEAIGTDEALELRGQAGLANARLAYAAYEEVFSTPRWEVLEQAGARRQRPLWASTGVKNPDYPDTLYVTELVARGTVNTMPGSTLDKAHDHAQVHGDTLTGTAEASEAVMDHLERLGISYTEVVEQLEQEGVKKFADSWTELQQTVSDELARVSTADDDAQAQQ
ncbi:transaldolase [uncultured Pseudokineococcus sp.]|uniref:transaldolase n=1 Tax=uncultured Pseudokineococcus sp. TaxID=1642928 RepID=UPI00262E246A|nr:transaldolase [uncultured Pseudokineococcus sp.]